MHTVSAAAFP